MGFKHRFRKTMGLLASAAFLALLLALPATADWLVTSEGDTIETQGPWRVKGRMVVFTDAKGTLSSLRASSIDLEASEAVTAKAKTAKAAETAKAGNPEAARPDTVVRETTKDERPRVMVLTNADVARAEIDRPAAELATQAPVVMYSTSWCGYCRKARAVLDELGVSYVEKDIEKSAEAKREHAAIANGRGVPVLDIDGTVVRGFSEKAIRRAVAKLDLSKGSTETEAAEGS